MDKVERLAGEQELDVLWAEVKALTPGTVANRLALGQRFRDLRAIYSDRNIGGRRLTSGHGSEEEIRRRGYKPRSVRQWIADFEAALSGKPLASDRRKERRMRARTVTISDALTAFVALLPFRAIHAAYREAAKQLHPNHGGDEQKMRQLNELWQQVRTRFVTEEV